MTVHYYCYRKSVQILFRIYEVLTVVCILPTLPTAVILTAYTKCSWNF